VGTVCSAAPWVATAATLATVLILIYTLTNLGINTDTGNMLSESLPFRRSWRDYKKTFPQYLNTILLVIDGATPDLARDASQALAARLKRETDIFKTVYLPGGDSFFEKNALLYLSLEELEDLADNLSRVQPCLARLTRDQSLRGFFSLLTSATEAVRSGENFDLAPMFDRVSAAIQASLNQNHYEFSWQELIFAEKSNSEERRRIIVVQPQLDSKDLVPTARAMRELRQLVRQLQLNPEHGVRVRLTGEAALEYEELISVSRGAGIAGLMALLMVLIVLFIGLGSPRLVIATLVTLLMGLIWTAGFATVALGKLNLISVAFAVLYIGLSVDYAVHFCMRYREMLQLGHTHMSAVRGSGQDIGSSLFLCAISTAIGFYAFIPTAFTGVSELGLIAGTGMFISLFANLTLLPALLTLFPISPKKASPPDQTSLRRSTFLLGLPVYHARIVLIGGLLLGLAGLVLLPQVRFDYNPLNLRDPATESVSTYADLFEQSKTSPWSIAVIAPNEAGSGEHKARLNGVDQVKASITLHDFIPPHQQEKLAIIEEIRLLLGPELLETQARSRADAAQRMAALDDLKTELDRFLSTERKSTLAESGKRLSRSLERFTAALESADQPAEMLANLEARLIGSLAANLRSLQNSLSAGTVSMADLPKELVRRWVSPDGRYRINVLPRENVNDNEALNRFVAAVRAVAPDATGAAVISLEAGKAIVRAFQQALFSATIAIAILLIILLQPKSDTLLVLSPLLLAGVLTGAAMVVLDVPFNFANVIALPLLLGVGVDSSIHMVRRYRTAPPANGNLLQTSTARGVLFSGLTTFCSFGNLAFSSHRGLASMGMVLTVGMGFTLLCTLVVLPALLAIVGRRH